MLGRTRVLGAPPSRVLVQGIRSAQRTYSSAITSAQLEIEKKVPHSQRTNLGKKNQLTLERKLTPQVRLARYNDIIKFLQPRLGRLGYVPRDPNAFFVPGLPPPLPPAGSRLTPQARNSAWLQLFQLASSEEQLTQIAKMFPGWVESGRVWPERVTEAFVRRTQDLHCPHLALKVFSEPQIYRFPLTISAVRTLIHTFHVKFPLEDTMAIVGLYHDAAEGAKRPLDHIQPDQFLDPTEPKKSKNARVQVKYRPDGYAENLPPLWSDLPSTAMVISACLDGRKRTRDSVILAKELLPKLKILLTDPDVSEVTAEARRVLVKAEAATLPDMKFAVTTTSPYYWTPVPVNGKRRSAAKRKQLRKQQLKNKHPRGTTPYQADAQISTRPWVRWSLTKIERALRVSVRMRRPVIYVESRRKRDQKKPRVGTTAFIRVTRKSEKPHGTSVKRPFVPREKKFTLKSLTEEGAAVPNWLNLWRRRAGHVQLGERGGERKLDNATV